jgi:hypothetical protein
MRYATAEISIPSHAPFVTYPLCTDLLRGLRRLPLLVVLVSEL